MKPPTQPLESTSQQQNNKPFVKSEAWCCSPPSNPCCPKISLMSDGTYQILDDYGSTINLDKKSISEVIKQVSDNLQ